MYNLYNWILRGSSLPKTFTMTCLIYYPRKQHPEQHTVQSSITKWPNLRKLYFKFSAKLKKKIIKLCLWYSGKQLISVHYNMESTKHNRFLKRDLPSIKEGIKEGHVTEMGNTGRHSIAFHFRALKSILFLDKDILWSCRAMCPSVWVSGQAVKQKRKAACVRYTVIWDLRLRIWNEKLKEKKKQKVFFSVILLNKNRKDSWKIPENAITGTTSLCKKKRQLSLELPMTNRDDKHTQTSMTV